MLYVSYARQAELYEPFGQQLSVSATLRRLVETTATLDRPTLVFTPARTKEHELLV